MPVLEAEVKKENFTVTLTAKQTLLNSNSCKKHKQKSLLCSRRKGPKPQSKYQKQKNVKIILCLMQSPTLSKLDAAPNSATHSLEIKLLQPQVLYMTASYKFHSRLSHVLDLQQQGNLSSTVEILAYLECCFLNAN